MTTRYFIFLAYDGTGYHGWQVQPGSVTVQKILDKSLSLVTGSLISTTGAGRTDTGVHAKIFCAHFDSSDTKLAEDNNLVFRLNRFLPPDISIKEIKRVTPDAHARFSAISRTYNYYVSRKKDPFSQKLSWFIHGDLDIELMNLSGKILRGYSDFTSFCRLHSDTKSNVCRIYRADWEEEGEKLVFTITADRFLRNMVRAIVGTMIDLGRHRISIGRFEDILREKNRSAAGMSAPAKGLFLAGIEYPPEIFI